MLCNWHARTFSTANRQTCAFETLRSLQYVMRIKVVYMKNIAHTQSKIFLLRLIYKLVSHSKSYIARLYIARILKLAPTTCFGCMRPTYEQPLCLHCVFYFPLENMWQNGMWGDKNTWNVFQKSNCAVKQNTCAIFLR